MPVMVPVEGVVTGEGKALFENECATCTFVGCE